VFGVIVGTFLAGVLFSVSAGCALGCGILFSVPFCIACFWWKPPRIELAADASADSESDSL
jgi:hypothetical protein